MLRLTTVNKRIKNAIERYIPEESDAVKSKIFELISIIYRGLLEEAEEDDNGKPYSNTRNLNFAISITLDDVDTPQIINEARKEVNK